MRHGSAALCMTVRNAVEVLCIIMGNFRPFSRSMSKPCRAGFAARSKGSCAACLNVQTANSMPECLSRRVPWVSKTHAKMACKQQNGFW